MRYHWTLDRHLSHLNHGSFGAAPRVVQDTQRRWRDELETDPTGFFELRYQPALDTARSATAEFVGADPAGLAFVTNATTGVASVLGSLQFGPGDEIVVTDHTYNAVRNIAEVTAARTGATVVTATIPFPNPEPAVEAVLECVGPRTRLVVVDHVTSPTALVLDVPRIVAALEPDVPVLVDGAHAPGMLPLDLEALGASFYTGNLHKWVCAPKGAGFLVVAEHHRESIRPPVISHGWNTPRADASVFHRLFDWAGTFDPSAWLSVPTAIETIGGMLHDGWPGVMGTNHRLALDARRVLTSRLGIEPPAPEEMIGSMVALPLSGPHPGLARRLRDRGIVAVVSAWPNTEHAVLRVSAHLYNALDEYEAVAEAILAEG